MEPNDDLCNACGYHLILKKVIDMEGVDRPDTSTGFDRVVIKAHGRSEGRAIRNAIKVAAKAVRGDLIGRIRDGVGARGGNEALE